MAVPHRLAALPDVRIESTERGHVSHEQALAMARAHGAIDECVTGSYHRNSLEGLAAGAVVAMAWGCSRGWKRSCGVAHPKPTRCLSC